MRAYPGLLMILAGCASVAPISLPEKVGPWSAVSKSPKAASPETQGVWVYQYEGPSTIEVTFRDYRSETSAFEAFQKWRVEPGTLPFYQGRLLIVPSGTDKGQLLKFAETLKATLQ